MKRTLFRRVFRRKILLLVSLSLVLLLALLLVVVHTPWVRAFALKKAAAYVEKQYGIKLVADSLQYDLATLRFWLTNVSLTVAKSNLPAFFQSDEVRVRLPVSFLFKKGFHLKELSMERPRVRIIYSDRGIPNTPSLPASTTPISFILEKASIREGLFVFSDPASHIDIKMPGIGIDVFWLERSVHALRLAAKDEGLAEIGRTRIPIQGLLLAGKFDPDQASIKELSVSVDHNRLQIKGEVKDFLSPRFQLEAQADFVAPDIQRILNLQEHLEGRLELRANLSGGFKIFTAEGKLAGRNLGFGFWRKADLAATFRWDGRSFSVPSFRVESPFGNLFGKAGSSAQDGGRENSVEVSWDSLDLRRVSEDLKLPLKIASRSEGNLQARWSGTQFPSLRAKADIKLSPIPGVSFRRGIPVALRLDKSGSRARNLFFCVFFSSADPGTARSERKERNRHRWEGCPEPGIPGSFGPSVVLARRRDRCLGPLSLEKQKRSPPILAPSGKDRSRENLRIVAISSRFVRLPDL